MKRQYNGGTLSISWSKTSASVFIFLCFIPSFSQISGSSHDGTNRYSEELYVRTDRDLYIAGEDVYLKLFCISGLTHNPSGLSRVGYVTLLDERNNPLVQEKISIDLFSGSGHLTIPDTLVTGNYYIASCTRWMQNYSPCLYSYRKITVINPFTVDRIKIPAKDKSVNTVTFFPEGGSLIRDIENTVGFRCLDKNMEPVAIKGLIADSSNNVICRFESDENGFGLIRLIPPGGNRLYFIPDQDGQHGKRFELPPAEGSGVTIAVSETNPDRILSLKISISNDLMSSGKRFSVKYDHASLAPFILDINPLAGNEIIINRNSLPAGLGQIIIEDETGRVYSKRWIYNSPERPVNITVKPDRQSYSRRDPVKLEISVEDPEGRPLHGDFLVSAIKSFTLAEPGTKYAEELQLPGLPLKDNRSGILTFSDRLIFLGADDSLALTNFTGDLPDFLPEPDGHLINGVIINTQTGNPLRNTAAVLSFVGKMALCRFTKTDDNGRFRFVSTEEGVREIVVQPFSPDLDEYYVDLDNPFPETYSRLYPPAFSLDTALLRSVSSAIVSMQIRKMYDPFMPVWSTTHDSIAEKDFYGMPDNSTLTSIFIQLSSLKEILKELVPGVITTTRQGKTYINTLYRYKDFVTVRNPLVIVDGVPVFDHEKILAIPVEQFEKIDVLNKAYFLSDMTIGGIIDITTYRGDLSVPVFDKPIFRQEFQALQARSRFMSPDYSDASRKESRVPDFRNTLYWNPSVTTDENGNASVEFYTSDEPGEYAILVEGFTSDGRKGSATATILVSYQE